MTKSSVQRALILGGWLLLLASCALPSWRILPYVNIPGTRSVRIDLAAGDWRGFQCAYMYYPCWIQNILAVLAPLMLAVRNKRAIRIYGGVFWVACLSVFLLVYLEYSGRGILFQDPAAGGSQLLVGCYLWLAAYFGIAAGLTFRRIAL